MICGACWGGHLRRSVTAVPPLELCELSCGQHCSYVRPFHANAPRFVYQSILFMIKRSLRLHGRPHCHSMLVSLLLRTEAWLLVFLMLNGLHAALHVKHCMQ